MPVLSLPFTLQFRILYLGGAPLPLSILLSEDMLRYSHGPRVAGQMIIDHLSLARPRFASTTSRGRSGVDTDRSNGSNNYISVVSPWASRRCFDSRKQCETIISPSHVREQLPLSQRL
ncbi:hypothetical protein EDB86DRAFT_2943720 [Lactarius hatsudake]|nr:hypothetical protein EDB86DRAFT_2943720 [Lactarius hatsudake]